MKMSRKPQTDRQTGETYMPPDFVCRGYNNTTVIPHVVLQQGTLYEDEQQTSTLASTGTKVLHGMGFLVCPLPCLSGNLVSFSTTAVHYHNSRYSLASHEKQIFLLVWITKNIVIIIFIFTS